jgi:hypothetical protein
VQDRAAIDDRHVRLDPGPVTEEGGPRGASNRIGGLSANDAVRENYRRRFGICAVPMAGGYVILPIREEEGT